MPLRIFPVASSDSVKPTFANDWHAPRSGGRLHEGTDILAPDGATLLAVDDGKLSRGFNELGGNTLSLKAADGLRYYYAHLSRFEETFGSAPRDVKAGDVVGYVGRTGNAVASVPHVHFGVYNDRAGGEATNPYPMLLEAERVTLQPGQTWPTGSSQDRALHPWRYTTVSAGESSGMSLFSKAAIALSVLVAGYAGYMWWKSSQTQARSRRIAT